MIFDVGRRYPRGYRHRHKFHERPEGFGQEGPAEMFFLLNLIDSKVEGRTNDRSMYEVNDAFGASTTHINKVIYSSHPHITADNHFSGDHVLEYGGEMGVGITVTTRRDRFPKGLKPYFHHQKVKPGDLKARVMRYENPIIAIKQVEATETTKAYTKTHVSFQSTGCTNISGVNNLPSAGLYVTQKSRGKGSNKRVWGIEQNEGRQTYLSQYYAVDNTDHMISNAMIGYITWKYWHSPYLHGLAMAIVAAFDMYVECCEGELDSDWFIPKKERRSFQDYRLLLSQQMLRYSPKDKALPGDEFFRAWTRRTKRQREKTSTSSNVSVSKSYSTGGVSIGNCKKAKLASRRLTPWLCGDLTHVKKHLASIKKTGNKGTCEVCGKGTSFKCGICDKYLCVFDNRKWSGGNCLLSYHDDSFFGISKSDHADLHNRSKSKWKAPTDGKMKSNARRIGVIKMAIAEEEC